MVWLEAAYPEMALHLFGMLNIFMMFLQARLFVDGKLFVKSKHNEDIIDDWPLHPSKKAHDTKLVVGACWEGTAI